jgi:hypothetical protein
MTDLPELRHGLRHDPMRTIHEDESLQGALCRQLLKLPARESDAATIADEVADTLAKQLPDGAFGETTEDTAGALNRLFELGQSADAPEVQRGLDALLTQHRTGATPEAPEGDNLTSPIGAHARAGFLSRDTIDALVLGGRHAAPETPAALRHMADHPETWLSATGCPWTANFFMQTLWRARHVEAVEDTVLVGLRWFERHMDAAGLVGYMGPVGPREDGRDHRPSLGSEAGPADDASRPSHPEGGWRVG